MRFSKWHGIGNDFVIVDEQDLRSLHAAGDDQVTEWPDGTPRLRDAAVIAVCDRHFGVGADGILVLGPSDSCSARMRIHNADGSIADMCGNGIRVAARWLVERDMVAPDADGGLTIETTGGVMRPALLPDGRVRVDMGVLTTDGVEALEIAEVDGGPVVLSGRIVSVGNPHFVVRREPAGDELQLLGPHAEHHARFPDRTNVEFYEVEDAGDGVVRMRVWERGVGETLACGTGACAVAFSARADAGLGDRITVLLPGGPLELELDGDRAFMTGAAHLVHDGELELSQVVAGAPATLEHACR